MKQYERWLQPKNRSRLRLKAGSVFYTCKRYAFWHFGKIQFAKTHSENPLPCPIFSHHSPLLRKLKDVDMQYQWNKIVNLKIAVKRLDGLLIHPGETFSYWKTIGRPTEKKGYVNGMVLFCGTYGKGIGGGLCQLSNLIYWMTLHTPLTVIERYRHSYDVFPDSNRVLPFGSGATCVYPYRDLMIRNDTPFTIQLCVQVAENDLKGEWRADQPIPFRYEIIERNHCMKSEIWGGFSRHNQLYRRQYDLEGNCLGEELVTENHALMMYSPFLESGQDA